MVESEPAGERWPLTSFVAGADARDVIFKGSADDRVLGPGSYRLRAVSTDAAGNSSTTLSEPVTLRAERLESYAWRTRVKAATSVIKRFAGPCGALRTPATRKWKGSLAYVGGTTCRDPEKAYVQAIHAVHVPTSVVKRYRQVKVSVLGGPSLRAPRGSYLVLGYYRDGRTWDFALIHDVDTRPFVAWSTGLSFGSRYDVRSFIVEVTYDRLELPHRRTTVAPAGLGRATVDVRGVRDLGGSASRASRTSG